MRERPLTELVSALWQQRRRKKPMTPVETLTIAELEAELRRRKEAAKADRRPAFVCKRCGVEEYLWGMFSAARYDRQALAFEAAHKDCELCIDGGGI